MTTELLEEQAVTAETPASTGEDTPATREPLATELDRLLRFKNEHVPKEGMTPCPACTTLVMVAENDCPHCSSYIAANNALVRETLRRIEEIESQLDSEQREIADAQRLAKNRSLWGRFRGLFSTTPGEPAVPPTPLIEENAPRFLDRVREGDQLIILARVGSWYQVKTRDSKTGWVYSTMLEDE